MITTRHLTKLGQHNARAFSFCQDMYVVPLKLCVTQFVKTGQIARLANVIVAIALFFSYSGENLTTLTVSTIFELYNLYETPILCVD